MIYTPLTLSHSSDEDYNSHNTVKISVILDTTTDYLLNGTPSDKDSELSYAKILLRRNVKKMTTEQKIEIVNLLF